MSITGPKFLRIACALMLGITVSVGASSPVSATSTQSQKTQSQKKKKKVQQPPPPPLPSGPTGPVQQIPLDSIGPVPPQVSFQNNQLTIVAPNSTLADILRAVRKQTGAEIDIPPAPERVVTHLGPGPARAVVAQLLNGSRFNYVLLGSPADETMLTRVVLVAKSGPDVTPGPAGANAKPTITQANNAPNTPEDAASDAEAEAAEENMNADEAPPDQPAADAEQPANNGDQPTVKTPQQMLQEMQQRQMQLQQQQQQGGQVPVPGSGMPPHPPQEQ